MRSSSLEPSLDTSERFCIWRALASGDRVLSCTTRCLRTTSSLSSRRNLALSESTSYRSSTVRIPLNLAKTHERWVRSHQPKIDKIYTFLNTGNKNISTLTECTFLMITHHGLVSSKQILGGSSSNSFSLSSEIKDDIMRSSSVTTLRLLGSKPILKKKLVIIVITFWLGVHI